MAESNHANTNSTSVVVKSGIWFTVCNVVTKSIGFITTPIFTRLLTKTEFGEYNNFTTWTGIILLITSLNLEASLIRARFDFEDDLDSYITSMVSLSSLSTFLWFVVFLIFTKPFQKLLSLNQAELYAMFLYLMFYPAIQLFQTKERYQYRYKNTVLITLLVVAGTALLSVLLVIIMENKLAGRIIGTVLPIIIIGAALLTLIIKKAPKVQLDYWKYALPFTLPFIPHLLSMFLLGSMDKVMIRQICGAEDLALYSLAYTVGTIITLLITSMNNAFSPWLGEQMTKKDYGKIKKVSVPFVAFFAFCSITAVLITPEILMILGGRGYIEAKNVVPPVFAGCLMQFVYCMYVNVEQFEKKTIGMAGASVLAAGFNYITNYIFIRKYGYIAAAYTTFFSYMLLMCIHIFLVWKIGRKEVYDTGKITVICIIGSAVLLCMNYTFGYSLVRYITFTIIVLIVLAAAYHYRTLIKHYILRRQ